MLTWWKNLGAPWRRAILGSAAVVAIAIVAVVVIAGGDSGGDDGPDLTTTTEPGTGPVAPLTGLRLVDEANASRPALAVKIDNLDTSGESALPQAGLARADIVFEELVEGDITRLVAVYQSQDPGQVGPVRSARTTDVKLLPQLGSPLLAWSGGNDGVVEAVRSSPSIIDMGFDMASDAYVRDSARGAPHNLFVDGDQIYDLAGPAPQPEPLFGYRDDDEAPAAAAPADGVDINWGSGPSTSPVAWDWDAELELYVRSQAGRPHVDDEENRLVAQNIVVLVTSYGQSEADTRSPEALTVGEGDVMVLTDGQVVAGTWARASEDEPATLTDADGATIELTPGQTWVELTPEGAATVR